MSCNGDDFSCTPAGPGNDFPLPDGPKKTKSLEELKIEKQEKSNKESK